ncbi:MAG TPA: DNA lyase [Solirubrobacteraceae bacterium]|nr:DNA lyase [Solirubrobacteraceae bacterium]
MPSDLSAFKRPTRARVARVRDRLREVYGIPSMRPHGDAIAELVLTVLSQSTNDRNRDVAYLRLRERFASWEQVRDAPLGEVEEAIRPGGISKVKSARIQAILRAISEGQGEDGALPPGSRVPEDGALPPGSRVPRGRAPRGRAPRGQASDEPELSLAWLEHAPIEQARDYLVSLPGVGRKTAACVLLFAYGRRDVPVDTHVSRVGMRLRLLRPGAPFEELHDSMLALTPPGEELELHVNLLRHGRRTCHARSPACDECALARMCPSRGEFQPRGSTAKAITA